MGINLFPFTIVWMLLAALVIGLILYRKWVAKDEDDRLHTTASEMGMVARQAAIAHRLESIDRWGQALTLVALVYGLAVAAGHAYQIWLGTSAR